jgi:UDP-4-amino-4,6-dideoxy-N-acetyl-beta-L-altrosamine N-acetyltransferase
MTVRIRPLEAGDAEMVVAWRGRPDVHREFFSDEPPTLESHRQWFESYRQRDDREEFLILDADRPVGTVGLSCIDRRHQRAELGVLIGEPSARGRGIAEAASRLILARAFDMLGLQRVYLHVFPENDSALRLYGRLGFQPEGLLRKHVIKDGVFRDVAVMGVLAGEFGPSTARAPSSE